MGYSVLKNTLEGIDLRIALFDVQSLSYRIITQRKYRDIPLPIGDNGYAGYNPNNTYYDALKEKFDLWNANAVQDIYEKELDGDGNYVNKELLKIVQSVIKINGKRRIRRAKKQSTRVIKEVRKMFQRGYYGNKNEELKKALELFHKAFRESFVIIRTTLPPSIYKCIPQDLSITLYNGETYNLSSLYQPDVEVKRYLLRKDIQISFTDLRNIQILIAPHIFEEIHLKPHKSRN